MPLLRRRDNTLARELFFPWLHTSKNACQVASNVLRENATKFCKAWFTSCDVSYCDLVHTLKKIVWKTPRRLRTGLSPTPSPSAAPKSHLLQEPDVLLHRVAVKLWSQGAVFHAVPGNGKVVQRQVADKSLSRKTAYIMYVYIYILRILIL